MLNKIYHITGIGYVKGDKNWCHLIRMLLNGGWAHPDLQLYLHVMNSLPVCDAPYSGRQAPTFRNTLLPPSTQERYLPLQNIGTQLSN